MISLSSSLTPSPSLPLSLSLSHPLSFARSLSLFLCSCNEKMSCSSPVYRIVNARAALAVLANIIVGLLAVLAGSAVPWVSQALSGGMIAVAVLASLCAAATVLASWFFVVPKWVNTRCCCLCQQGGNARKVHIDVEASPSVCGQCKTRYEGMHRAPAGALAYDAQAGLNLIVGVSTTLALKPGFVPGLPTTKFEASSLAGEMAAGVEDTLHKATAVQLPQAVAKLLRLYPQVDAAVNTLKASTDKLRGLQEAAAQQFPLSSQLGSQSLEALEKELAALKSAEKAAADAARYSDAQDLSNQHAQRNREVYDLKRFKTETLDPMRVCSASMSRESEELGDLFAQVGKSANAPYDRAYIALMSRMIERIYLYTQTRRMDTCFNDLLIMLQ